MIIFPWLLSVMSKNLNHYFLLDRAWYSQWNTINCASFCLTKELFFKWNFSSCDWCTKSFLPSWTTIHITAPGFHYINWEKEERYIKNWRPITLINVDAKLASKVLVGRIKKVSPNIIKHDQTAYIRGRYVGQSICSISDILEYTEENNSDGILFNADFEKAFDSVEHFFILATLWSFGFGPQFIHWVRVILKKAESLIMNNSIFSFVERMPTRWPSFCISFHNLHRSTSYTSARKWWNKLC